MSKLKKFFSEYFPVLKNRTILKIIILSFFLSFLLVGIIIYYLWNIAPSLTWIHIIIGNYYYDLVKVFWDFIIFSFLIFLIPPLFYIIVSFFLDSIVEAVYLTLSKKRTLKLKSLSYFSGIIVSIKIFLYTSFIFLFVILLKVFFISNNYLILIIQFLLSSFMICKEYSNLICFKFSIRNPDLLSNIKNGAICNILFSIPIVGFVAPILTTIIITALHVKEKNL